MSEAQQKKWKDNLLLYLESSMVEHGGLFRWNKIGNDSVFLREYEEEGYVQYKRLPFKQIEKMRYHLWPAGPFTHTITEFSEEAWIKSHQLRRERASRLSAGLRRDE